MALNSKGSKTKDSIREEAFSRLKSYYKKVDELDFYATRQLKYEASIHLPICKEVMTMQEKMREFLLRNGADSDYIDKNMGYNRAKDSGEKITDPSRIQTLLEKRKIKNDELNYLIKKVDQVKEFRNEAYRIFLNFCQVFDIEKKDFHIPSWNEINNGVGASYDEFMNSPNLEMTNPQRMEEELFEEGPAGTEPEYDMEDKESDHKTVSLKFSGDIFGLTKRKSFLAEDIKGIFEQYEPNFMRGDVDEETKSKVAKLHLYVFDIDDEKEISGGDSLISQLSSLAKTIRRYGD